MINLVAAHLKIKNNINKEKVFRLVQYKFIVNTKFKKVYQENQNNTRKVTLIDHNIKLIKKTLFSVMNLMKIKIMKDLN